MAKKKKKTSLSKKRQLGERLHDVFMLAGHRQLGSVVELVVAGISSKKRKRKKGDKFISISLKKQ